MLGKTPEFLEVQVHFTPVSLEKLSAIDQIKFDAVLNAEAYLTIVDRWLYPII